MNLPRVVVAVLLRSLVIVGVTAAYVAAVARSETTDALGAGLLAFLILVTIAFVWAVVDGIRRGLLEALLTWLLASVVAGVGIPVALALTDDRDLAAEVGDGAVFFAVLLVVPALLGLSVGGLVHRLRDRSEVAA
ncbi:MULTISPECIES: hypothetical protein [unclassified Nocardioides]|uniref:hypothetical protein n=1 Tax=unclassified Nocardioides TaxID=2615069 RepID=UPI00005705BB|nr:MULTISPECIES: hypothetical protein [unclassified Nocardioides]ABL82484.1 hypothetical protein Noca_2982 [Nocardioides sp. JS614]MBI2245553.1 hypothetical protein [Nocardioides sp.]